jgi:hypothetical protein
MSCYILQQSRIKKNIILKKKNKHKITKENVNMLIAMKFSKVTI